VCKCVLYYCHRVATQLQLTNISHHIMYHIMCPLHSFLNRKPTRTCTCVCVCFVFLFYGRCWNQLALHYQLAEYVVTVIFREMSLKVRRPRHEGQNNVLSKAISTELSQDISHKSNTYFKSGQVWERIVTHTCKILAWKSISKFVLTKFTTECHIVDMIWYE
jgi:hypothetical protein